MRQFNRTAFLLSQKLGGPNFVTRLRCCAGFSKRAVMKKEIRPLRHLAAGQKGIVTEVKAYGELGRRIRDMGLVPGTPIQIQGRAPLKDPVAVRVRDFTLSLRNSEADFIFVEVESDS
jgi:ferrous iron transport protein A